MNIQTVIVALIILAALVYAGNLLRHKLSAFKPKNKTCGSDCGCGDQLKIKN